jgi:hypothetical protein
MNKVGHDSWLKHRMVFKKVVQQMHALNLAAITAAITE